MSKEKQIEEAYVVNNEQIKEMADFLWKNTLIHTEDLCHDVSETCYNAGYRKSEWISVEERLPELYTDVITYDTILGVQIDSILSSGEFVLGYQVTHWMPLPEPPKNEN